MEHDKLGFRLSHDCGLCCVSSQSVETRLEDYRLSGKAETSRSGRSGRPSIHVTCERDEQHSGVLASNSSGYQPKKIAEAPLQRIPGLGIYRIAQSPYICC